MQNLTCLLRGHRWHADYMPGPTDAAGWTWFTQMERVRRCWRCKKVVTK